MPDRPDATLGKSSRARQNAPESTYRRTSTADESASADTDDASSAHSRDASTADPMSRAKETLSNTASQAGDKVASRLDTQKDRAAEGLGSVAQALRQASSQLQGPNQPAAAQQYVASAADQIERLSTYLRSTNTREIVGGVEQFARQQPALFVSGAFVLGVLGARFLKSSGQSASDRAGSASRR